MYINTYIHLYFVKYILISVRIRFRGGRIVDDNMFSNETAMKFGNSKIL